MNAVEITKTFLNMMPIMEAYLQGKTIEYKDFDDWKETTSPAWDLHTKYRVKPEPKYVPFDMSHNLLGSVVFEKESGHKYLITAQGINGVTVGAYDVSYKNLLTQYTFSSNSPCGKLQQ